MQRIVETGSELAIIDITGVPRVDCKTGGVLFAGAGNISGRLLSGVEDRSLASQHGTAELQIRTLQDAQYGWPAHGMLIMHSDGLHSRWSLDKSRGILRHHPTMVAGWLMREFCRGNDDATVVVLRPLEA